MIAVNLSYMDNKETEKSRQSSIMGESHGNSEPHSIMALGADNTVQVTSADMTNSHSKMLKPTIVSKLDAARKS